MYINVLDLPIEKPSSPQFSSGPCKKYPGFRLDKLSSSLLGRSHRAPNAKKIILELIEKTRKILNIPDDYKISLTPASNTGAVEMAIWNLIGARKVNILVWEQFGKEWLIDIVEQLKIKNFNLFDAEFGKLPDIKKIDFNCDTIFVWNGTTSGVRVPNADFIPQKRAGLTICDATSAVFAQKIDFNKLDVTTFSWQKALGGEAQHGFAIFSPKAIKRLQEYKPEWPIPKIFRIANQYKINEKIFKGDTINTPSMLCVEDFYHALQWAEKQGLQKLQKIADDNSQYLYQWSEKSLYIKPLPQEKNIRSNTSCCFKFTQPKITELKIEEQQKFVKQFTKILEEQNVAYDIQSYRSAPPGIRIWTGPTIEKKDIICLTKWLDWAWYKITQN